MEHSILWSVRALNNVHSQSVTASIQSNIKVVKSKGIDISGCLLKRFTVTKRAMFTCQLMWVRSIDTGSSEATHLKKNGSGY